MKIYKLIFLSEEDDYYNYVDKAKNEDFEKYLKYFVKMNKHKYKIIYNNKMYPLQSIFQIKENKIGKLRIKLICYNHIKNIPPIFTHLPKYYGYKIEKFKKNNKYV